MLESILNDAQLSSKAAFSIVLLPPITDNLVFSSSFASPPSSSAHTTAFLRKLYLSIRPRIAFIFSCRKPCHLYSMGIVAIRVDERSIENAEKEELHSTRRTCATHDINERYGV